MFSCRDTDESAEGNMKDSPSGIKLPNHYCEKEGGEAISEGDIKFLSDALTRKAKSDRETEEMRKQSEAFEKMRREVEGSRSQMEESTRRVLESLKQMEQNNKLLATVEEMRQAREVRLKEWQKVMNPERQEVTGANKLDTSFDAATAT